MSKTRNKFTVKRIALCAVMIAVFYAMSLLSVEVSGVKITFDSLPIILTAMLFGPVDGFLVGFLGEFFSQMMKYGFDASTLLWMIPPAIRGLFIGLCAMKFKNSMSIDAIITTKRPYVYFVVCILSALLTSVGNTLAYYAASKMYGYYNFALVFGVAGIRILTNMLSTFLVAVVSIPILMALKKSNLISGSTKPAKP